MFVKIVFFLQMFPNTCIVYPVLSDALKNTNTDKPLYRYLLQLWCFSKAAPLSGRFKKLQFILVRSVVPLAVWFWWLWWWWWGCRGGLVLKSDPACWFISDTPEGQRLHAVDGRLCDQTDTLTDAVNFTGGYQTAVITIADRELMIREDVSGGQAGLTRAQAEHVGRLHMLGVWCKGCNAGSCVVCSVVGFGQAWTWAGKLVFVCIVWDVWGRFDLQECKRMF